MKKDSINQLLIMLGFKEDNVPELKTVSIKLLLMIFLPAVLILGAIAVVSILYKMPISMFTRDTTAIADIHPISGLLSNLGILLWCVATTACAFAAFVLRSLNSREKFGFLIASALLSAYLMFDDLFQIHEDLGNRIGLNEDIIIILLGIAVPTYLIYFRKIIVQTDFVIFLLALSFLALSLVVDKIGIQFLVTKYSNLDYFIEDGIKWIGIVFWCSYYVTTSYYFIASNTELSGNAVKSDIPPVAH